MFKNTTVVALSVILVAFVAMIITSVFVPAIRDYLGYVAIAFTIASIGAMFLPQSSHQKI